MATRRAIEGDAREGWSTIVIPIGFGIVALAVEVYDHFHQVNVLALLLATGCLLAVLARLVLTFAQNLGCWPPEQEATDRSADRARQPPPVMQRPRPARRPAHASR